MSRYWSIIYCSFSVAGSFTFISGGHGTVMMKTRIGYLRILNLVYSCKFSPRQIIQINLESWIRSERVIHHKWCHLCWLIYFIFTILSVTWETLAFVMYFYHICQIHLRVELLQFQWPFFLLECFKLCTAVCIMREVLWMKAFMYLQATCLSHDRLP